MIALAENLLQFFFLFVIKGGVIDELIDFLVELWVRDFELRSAVFVKEGDRCSVFHTLLEVVDAHVVTEDLASAFFTGNERSAGEGYELRIRQLGPHVHRQGIVLAAVGLIGQHNDVVAFAQHGMECAGVGAELVDEGEDVTMVFAQELTKMSGLCGLTKLACGTTG